MSSVAFGVASSVFQSTPAVSLENRGEPIDPIFAAINDHRQAHKRLNDGGVAGRCRCTWAGANSR